MKKIELFCLFRLPPFAAVLRSKQACCFACVNAAG